MKKLDIKIWNTFWNIEIISEIEKQWNMRMFKAKCILCFKTKNIRLNSLIHSKKWCACTHEVHKKILTPEARKIKRLRSRYYGILQRCNNAKSINYKHYGWRWIKCEWNTFKEFYNDMWDSYLEWLTIDRINNDLNYCKENCRWISNAENQNNKRNNVIVEWWLTLKQWCKENWYNDNKYRIFCRDIRKWFLLNDLIKKHC